MQRADARRVRQARARSARARDTAHAAATASKASGDVSSDPAGPGDIWQPASSVVLGVAATQVCEASSQMLGSAQSSTDEQESLHAEPSHA